jgi:protein SCO1/2
LLVLIGSGCARSAPTASSDAGSDVNESTFSELRFHDQNGHTLDASSLSSSPLLLSFMFTRCPTVCPKQTRALVELRAALPESVRERVRFLSVSVDPDYDNPKTLREFAQAHNATGAGWSFLVGSNQHTATLTRRLAGFDPRTTNPSPGDHSTATYLFNRRGQVLQRYGAPLDVARIAAELGRVVAHDFGSHERSAQQHASKDSP